MQLGKLYKVKHGIVLWTNRSNSIGAVMANADEIVMCVESNAAVILDGRPVYRAKVLRRDMVYNLPSMDLAEQTFYFELAVGKQP